MCARCAFVVRCASNGHSLRQDEAGCQNPCVDKEQRAKIAVRGFAAVDAGAVANLLGELGYPATEPQVAARFERLGGNPDVQLLVAVMAGEVAGFAGLRREFLVENDYPSARLIALVVGERWRRCGLGTSLVREIETRAAAAGCVTIVLTSGDHRADAHAFYERLGYRASGRRFFKELPAVLQDGQSRAWSA
jgi:GNAT superfamily N-acetyltransferase